MVILIIQIEDFSFVLVDFEPKMCLLSSYTYASRGKAPFVLLHSKDPEKVDLHGMGRGVRNKG